MKLPAIRDWQKVRSFLEGSWPLPDPEIIETSDYRDCLLWMDSAKDSPFVAIDTEFNVETGFLFLVGLGYPGSKVLQFKNREATWVDRQRFGESLKDLVSRVPIIFQNGIADIPIIWSAYGISYGDYKSIEDTMLGHAVLWSDWPHTLEFLASVYGRHNKMKHLAGINDSLYNAGDVVDTISSWEGIQNEFKVDQVSENIYRKQSLNLIPIILKAQEKGLRPNSDRIPKAYQELKEAKIWAETTAQLFSGWPINIGSDEQLSYYLYELEKFPKQYKPKTENTTVDADAISTLRANVGPIFDADEESKEGLSIDEAIRRISEGAHPVLEARVVYAAAQQALSHYILPMCIVDKEGGLLGIRSGVYPRFLPHSQASGRWSTVDPPMAQIPKSLQDIVIPWEGEKWIEWDWSQIELRILAALSGDEIYQEAFNLGWDIHTLHTCDVFGWPYPEDKRDPHFSKSDGAWRSARNWGGKDDPRRRFSKVFIFRLNYGGEAKTATDIPGVKQLGLKAGDLVEGSRSYIKRHPWIKAYWESISDRGIANREVRTFMGRRRRLLVDGKAAMKRLIYNHPMQGGVSDVFNTTLIKIANECPTSVFAYGVHDAQKWAVKEAEYDILYDRMYSLVHEKWNINGREVNLPADFKKKG